MPNIYVSPLARMLHRGRFSYAAYGAAKRTAGWLVVFVALESGMTKLPAREPSSWEFRWMGEVYSFVEWQAGTHGWWLILLSTALITVCLQLQKRIGSPEVWDVLHALLSGAQGLVFSGVGYEVSDHHRVTLFRVRCYRNKLDLWGLVRQLFQCKPTYLVPVVRSGHTSQKTRAFFSIGDGENECAGVVGQCWFRNQIVSRWNLPDLQTEVNDGKILTYANESFAHPDLIRSRLPRMRAILAVPVQIKQELWGALVFDSRHPAQINQTNVDKLCAMLTGHVARMIEKIL